MKSARHLAPTGPYQERLREFDLREIDAAAPHSLAHRKYMARLTWVMGIIQRELPPGSRVLAGSGQESTHGRTRVHQRVNDTLGAYLHNGRDGWDWHRMVDRICLRNAGAYGLPFGDA